MHGPAQPATVPINTPQQFRHHPIDASALCNAMPMASVIGQDDVFRPQYSTGTGRNRLFSDLGMGGPLDLVFQK